MKIIPTIFALNKTEFKERFEKIVRVAKEIQIDFMDGGFVPSFGVEISDIDDLRKYKDKIFEAHIMCLNPDFWIVPLKERGFKKIIFHYEAVEDKSEIIKIFEKVKKMKMKVFLAINPETDVNFAEAFIKEADGILFMGVHPGREKQEFIPAVYENIKGLRKLSKKIFIQVDGGINLNVARNLKKIGVNAINTGSFVSDSDKPEKRLSELKNI